MSSFAISTMRGVFGGVPSSLLKEVRFHRKLNTNRKLSYMNMIKHRVNFEKKIDLNRAVCEAEKVVGYPTSFLNLRWLLSDEVANIALHLRKLMGSGHPLIHTVRDFLTGNNSPAWGLVVLLVSKVAGLNGEFKSVDKDLSVGVLHSQRALAEVTEMIRTSNIIHKSLVNVRNGNDVSKGDAVDLYFGNKISLLSGDYLLSTSYHTLACLKNQSLNELMCAALRDLVEVEFVGPRDDQNVALPIKPNPEQKDIEVYEHYDSEPYDIEDILGNVKAEWTLRNVLGGASLLGKSCQGTLMLAGHPVEVQERGYRIGKNVALAWQARNEIKIFSKGYKGPFKLVCAPLMFQLECEPELYKEIEKGTSSVDNVDYDLLRERVCNGNGLEKTSELFTKHSSRALDELREFPSTEARAALINIITATH
ncbi:decaprenyl-diphosphate synthase subunit 2-like [Agrilus planipennis]|uniref:Decaprenyl-diphosphate synthase subunit 2-like n=1 Tax=Agrilus planipennis TaxID=224129 RepID=A0A1W4XF66_AGRPL|nr:decaprenyl-diphosphate synthase subunit 2-like [Agrilus planipennis]